MFRKRVLALLFLSLFPLHYTPAIEVVDSLPIVLTDSLVSTPYYDGPSVIWGKDTGILAWTDSRNGNLDVFAQYLDSNLNRIGSYFVIGAGVGDQHHVALAALDTVVLAAWISNSSIKGRILSFNGYVGPEFTIKDWYGVNFFDLEVTSMDSVFLVAWGISNVSSYYARKVGTNGAVLNTSDVYLANARNIGRFGVAYLGHRIFLAFNAYSNEWWYVFGQIFSDSLTTIWGQTLTGTNSYEPALSHSDSSFIFSYEYWGGGSTWNLSAQAYSPLGTHLGGGNLSNAPGRQSFSEVGSAPLGSLVVWLDEQKGANLWQPWCGAIGYSGTIFVPNGLCIDSAVVPANYPGVCNRGTDFLVVWHNGNSVVGKRISAPEIIPAVGTIAGTVKDASTQQNLQGVLVEALQSAQVKGSGNTDENGNYSIPNLPAGSYDIRASKTGYEIQTQTGKNVVAGQTTTVDFQLAPLPTGDVSGFVYDGCTNSGLGGVLVEFLQDQVVRYSITTETPSGLYELSGVFAGTYDVRYSKTGYITVTLQRTIDPGWNVLNTVTLIPMGYVSSQPLKDAMDNFSNAYYDYMDKMADGVLAMTGLQLGYLYDPKLTSAKAYTKAILGEWQLGSIDAVLAGTTALVNEWNGKNFYSGWAVQVWLPLAK